MKLTILGCGTSTGVPVIGCGCDICSSTAQRNKRTRASALVTAGRVNVLIDTSTDLRAQVLSNEVKRIDAILFTHAHADHIHGIDDLRAFNHLQGGKKIPCYGSEHTIGRIRHSFDYIFADDSNEGWKPSLTTNIVEKPFNISGVCVAPVEIRHGRAAIFGYRIGDIAYLTDCSGIPEKSFERLSGLDLLVLGALRHTPHPTHFNIDQAIEAVARIKPKRTVLTHLGHNLDYTRDNEKLPSGIEMGFDGMTIEV